MTNLTRFDMENQAIERRKAEALENIAEQLRISNEHASSARSERAEIERLKADRQRLEWMIETGDSLWKGNGGDEFMLASYGPVEWFADWREAIDAGMREYAAIQASRNTDSS